MNTNKLFALLAAVLFAALVFAPSKAWGQANPFNPFGTATIKQPPPPPPPPPPGGNTGKTGGGKSRHTGHSSKSDKGKAPETQNFCGTVKVGEETRMKTFMECMEERDKKNKEERKKEIEALRKELTGQVDEKASDLAWGWNIKYFLPIYILCIVGLAIYIFKKVSGFEKQMNDADEIISQTQTDVQFAGQQVLEIGRKVDQIEATISRFQVVDD